MTASTRDTTLQLLDFVTRIAESESRLWILTMEAKVTQAQAKDIVAQLKGAEEARRQSRPDDAT